LGLRPKGLVVIGLPVAAVLVMAALLVFVANEENQAEAEVTHTLMLQGQVDRVLALNLDTETAVRGYAITRQDAFLEPYWRARSALPGEVARLRDLVRGQPGQLQAMAAVESLTAQRVALSDQTRRLVADSGSSPPADASFRLISLLQQGRATTDALRAQVAGMQAAEKRLLAQKRGRVNGFYHLALVAVTGSMLFGLAGGVLAMLLFTQGVLRKVEHLHENAGRLERGLPLVPLAAGGELGKLGRHLERAAGLLAERSAREAQLAAIVEASDDAIIGKSLDGRIVSWNAGAERTYGYTAAEMIGASTAVLIPPSRSDEMPPLLECIARGEHVPSFQTVRMTKSGSPIDVWVTISPVRDAAGHVVGASTITRDVTEGLAVERALREAQDAYRLIFENANEGMFYTTLDNQTTAVNPALAPDAEPFNRPVSRSMRLYTLHARRVKPKVSNGRCCGLSGTIDHTPAHARERCAHLSAALFEINRMPPGPPNADPGDTYMRSAAHICEVIPTSASCPYGLALVALTALVLLGAARGRRAS